MFLSEEEAEDLLGNVPEEQSTVVYFGDGHAAALRADEEASLPPMWGSTCGPLLGEVLQCTVSGVRVYRCGPRRKPEECFPFAQVDLTVVNNSTLNNHTPALLPPLEAARLNRLAAALVFSLLKKKDYSPFAEPVSLEEHPDYYQIISQPMDLGTMLTKAELGLYKTGDQVVEDINLIRFNCWKYCSSTFPKVTW
jgi:hypothetical protein